MITTTENIFCAKNARSFTLILVKTYFNYWPGGGVVIGYETCTSTVQWKTIFAAFLNDIT